MKKSLGAKPLVFPAPVFIVGSYDKEGKPNVMNAAWGGISSSQPPCISVSLRKATYTYGNIQHRKAFTVSIPSEQYVKEADYFGLVSGKNEDKFSKTGLTAIKSELVDAPYVKEFPLVLECKVINIIEIGLHTEFIGEVMDVKVDELLLDENGAIKIDALKPMIFATDIGKYFSIGNVVAKAFSVGKEIKDK